MITLRKRAKTSRFHRAVNSLHRVNFKPFLTKLTYCVSLFLYSAFLWSIEPGQINKQLKAADLIKTSNSKKLSEILNDIESELPHFSNKQKYYFLYLKGYESTNNGGIQEAINQYIDVEQNSKDTELIFRASISLINLYAFKKKWLNGFRYLDNISKEYRNISNPEIRKQGLIVAAIFYNELGQYEMTQSLVTRLLAENVTGRNLCLTLSAKLKADFSTSSRQALENEMLRAIEICSKINEVSIVNVLRTYLAFYYLEKDNHNQIINLLKAHLEEINNTNHQILIAETNSLLAQAYLKVNDSVSAKKHALSVITNKNTNDYIKAMVSAYKVLSIIAKQNNDYDSAFDYQDKYIKSKESLFEQTKAKQLAVESAKHHAIERENQIALLSKQKQISELELESQKQLQIVWSIAFISSAILIFFWFYRRTAQKELRRQKQINWELKELDKLKDRILTNTSHELRTPLNGIIGLSDLIVLEYEDEVKDELIQSVRLIGKSGTRLALIVNDILDLAQLKAHRISFYSEPFDLSKLISEVITLCRPLIKTDNLKIKFTDEGKEISVTQDMQRIQQVLFNLIGNAVKFTEKGEITVSCEQQSDHLWVHVKDTGIGIPADKIERVFKGFEQVDNSDTRKHQGSGIGLAISREIVTALGGKIQLKSELGKGTHVSFSFPSKHLQVTA